MVRQPMRLATVLLAAGFLLYAESGPARAHVYTTSKDIPLAVSLFDGKRHLLMNRGTTIPLTVQNEDGADCSAFIELLGANSLISVKTDSVAGAVKTRIFNITGVSVGSVELDLTVKGTDGCTENSHNPIVVSVLPPESDALKAVASAAKSELKLFTGELKASYADLRSTVSGTLSGYGKGETDARTAALGVVNAWYSAYTDGYFAAHQTLQNLSNYASGQLVSGGWPECTGPRGFADGGGGSFDWLRDGVTTQLRGYEAKLEKAISADIGAYTKIALADGLSLATTFRLHSYPDLDVSGPTVSPRPASPPPLAFGYSGSVSYAMPHEQSTCIAVAGISDLSLGNVRLQLFDGTGLVDTQTVSPTGSGTWSAMFDGVKEGKTYRVDASYLSGQPGSSRTRIYAPNFRHSF